MALAGACLAVVLFASQVQAAGSAVFHLDFAGTFGDVSGSAITTQVGSAVSLLPAGGPTLSGGTIDAASFAGDNTISPSGGLIPNEIKVPSNATFDALSNSAGSVVTWVKTAQDYQWNTILENLSFNETSGFELQTTFGWAGTFGSASGWGAGIGTSESVDPDHGLVSFNTGTAYSQFDIPVNRADPDDGIDTWCCQNSHFGDGDIADPVGKDLVTGVWTHVAYVWDNDTGNSTIYLDGVPGRETHDNTVSGYSPGDWTIGGTRSSLGGSLVNNSYFVPHPTTPNDLSRTLNGDLADFAMFDGVLTQTEIDQIIADGVSSLTGGGLAGDFDGDTDVDGSDFLQWQRDQTGNLSDWLNDYGMSASVATTTAATTSVPEPSGIALAIFGLGILASRRNSFYGFCTAELICLWIVAL